MEFLVVGTILLVASGLALRIALTRDIKVAAFFETTMLKLTTRSRWSLSWAAASPTLYLA